MNKVVNRAGIMMVLVVILAAGTLFFVGEYFLESDEWVMTQGSPHIYSDYSSVCGIVTDRDGVLLMDSTDGTKYSGNTLLRTSMVHWLGDREGNVSAPILSYYAAKMTEHDVVNGLYAYGNTDGHVTLTLSAKLQMAALEAMGDYKGTIAIYNYKTGEILCAVSTPAFDPDNLPDIGGDEDGQWEGAYINRFLKATYTPGSIFKIITTIAALETIDDIRNQTFTCSGEVSYGIDTVTCLREHGEQTLEEAFMNSCNCAYALVAEQLGAEVLDAYAEKLGITGSISFDGVTTTEGSVKIAGEADVMVAWSAIGQHKDLVNICQFMTLVGSIANGGTATAPYIVQEIAGGSWGTYTAEAAPGVQLMSEETARTLLSFMRNNVVNKYGEEAFHGFTVCAKSGTAEVGGEKNPNAMFTGFLLDEEYPLAFIVAVEDGGYGTSVCIPILSDVLSACIGSLGQEGEVS